jgi:hypothetical protein
MFGIDTKKIKAAFADFNLQIAAIGNQPSSDPTVQAIINFIQALSKAFE